MGRIRDIIERGLPDGDSIDLLVDKVNALVDGWIEQGHIKVTVLGMFEIKIHLPEDK